MKAIISIFVFFVLTFTIDGVKISHRFPKEVAKLNDWAKHGTVINGLLKLKEDGFLGDGGFGFVYEGTSLAYNRTVAIKFVPKWNFIESEREFYMFANLYAYQEPRVERYGFPVVYYRGQWKNYTLLALTKLDKDLHLLAKEQHHLKMPLDALILIRNFIFQSKYMHRCGVRHDDIKPSNIMVRGHRSFLIDFNQSSRMATDNGGYTLAFAARRCHKDVQRQPIDDWESFLYTICFVLNVPLDIFLPKNAFNRIFDNRFYNICKKKSGKILNCIRDNLDDEALKLVIDAFANEVFANDRSKEFPNYDRLWELVNDEIVKMHGNESSLPPMFSWLSEAEQLEAKREIEANPPLNITNIVEPSSINFETFAYPRLRNSAP